MSRVQRSSPAHRGDVDDGAAALTTTLAAVLVLMLVLQLLIQVTVGLTTTARLQGAADATALAVMSGSALVGGEGEPDVQAGQLIAGANGARLVAMDVAGWPIAVRVTVEGVAPTSWLPDRDGPPRARAAAAVSPR